MLMEIFKDAFEYSFKDKSILKLGALSFLSFLIVPIFIIFGYSYRVILNGVHGMINLDEKMPKFENLRELFIQGLKVAIIIFIYALPTLIISFLAIFNSQMVDIIKLNNHIQIDLGLGLVVIAIFWFLTFLFTAVAIPHTIYNKGSLKNAFNIKKLVIIIKSVGILEYILFCIGAIILFIGIFVSAFLLFQVLIGGINLLSVAISNPINIPGNVNLALFIAIFLLFIYPFFTLFGSRAIALIYNMR